jgi:hypothetical protein
MDATVSAHMLILNENVRGRRRQGKTVFRHSKVIVEALWSRIPGLRVCHLGFLYMR